MISQRRNNGRSYVAIITVVTVLWVSVAAVEASELFIGTASVSITPPQPVALSGQRRARIAHQVESPVTATAVALETRDGEKVLDQAIIISCDLVAIRDGIQDRFRERAKTRLPDFDINKLFMAATHSHTAPVTREGVYVIPDEGVIKPLEYVDFLNDRLEDAVVQAWRNRHPGGVSWGLGHALVAHNRRAVYADGNARMYG
ncbi:MAG: hypothetical protein ACYTG0_34280, partial [Planctomycetota bacterium]